MPLVRVSNGGTEVTTQSFSFSTPSGTDRSRTTVDCTKTGYRLIGASFGNVSVYSSNAFNWVHTSIESWSGNIATILIASNNGNAFGNGSLIAYYLPE